MTDLVSVATYRRITGDTSTSDDNVEEALNDALALVQDELNGRLLEHDERTETLSVKNGYVYPIATPISYADDYVIKGASVAVPSSAITFGAPAQEFELTYQGGFTEASLPRVLRNAIINTAADQLKDATPTTGYPDGAVSVKVGDTSVTFKDPIGSTSSRIIREDVAASIRKYRHGWI